MRLVLRPVHPDIVIVAIDDASIAAIGRWPWRRALHAELISRLTAQNPRAIGMDVLFNEADLDYPEDDLLLTDAIRRSERVVLPVLRRGYGPVSNQTDLPWPAFADAAAGLGHVHVAPDSDGVVRSLYLLEGPAAAPWHHFSTALQCVADRQPAATCGRSPTSAIAPSRSLNCACTWAAKASGLWAISAAASAAPAVTTTEHSACPACGSSGRGSTASVRS